MILDANGKRPCDAGGREARPKRSLGQNFLRDPNTVRRIVDALDIGPGDFVLEIGPGRGALSEAILEAGPRGYAAIEKDAALVADLKRRLPEIAVVHADALAFAWEALDRGRGIKLVGNLPYNIASPLMWEVVSRTGAFERAVFMTQLEVAQRVAAVPRTKAYGALSVWLQSFVVPTLVFKVGPNVFYPRPKVESGVIRLTPRPAGKRPVAPAALARLLKRCFQMRRKQIRKILEGLWNDNIENLIEKHGFSATSRPEEFPPEFFEILSDGLKSVITS